MKGILTLFGGQFLLLAAGLKSWKEIKRGKTIMPAFLMTIATMSGLVWSIIMKEGIKGLLNEFKKEENNELS